MFHLVLRPERTIKQQGDQNDFTAAVPLPNYSSSRSSTPRVDLQYIAGTEHSKQLQQEHRKTNQRRNNKLLLEWKRVSLVTAANYLGIYTLGYTTAAAAAVQPTAQYSNTAVLMCSIYLASKSDKLCYGCRVGAIIFRRSKR